MQIKRFLLAIFFSYAYYVAQANDYAVDFYESLGKNSPYSAPFWEQLSLEMLNPKSDWFKFIDQSFSPIEVLDICKENYTSKILAKKNLQKKPRIPRIFHQIWVGKNPFPEHYKAWQRTWQSIEGWEYRLWTDEDLESFSLINQELYDQEKNLGARADILRLEILYRIGGVYIDTDFECLKPSMFEWLHDTFDFYCGLHPLDCKTFFVNNAIVGSIPGHPIIKACIDSLQNQMHSENKHSIVVMRGPGLLNNMTLKYMNKGYQDIVFPPSYFYPLGVYEMRQEPFASMPFSNEKLDAIKQKVLKPETIAIHWWEGSWTKPTAVINQSTIK